MTGRGIAALIPALFGGLAALISFRYAYSLPLGAAAAAGVGWAVVVLCFDLSLMTAAPDRRACRPARSRSGCARSSACWRRSRSPARSSCSCSPGTSPSRWPRISRPIWPATTHGDHPGVRQADQRRPGHHHHRPGPDQPGQPGLWRPGSRRSPPPRSRPPARRRASAQFAGCGHGNRPGGAGPGLPVRLAELQNDQAALASAQAQATATKKPPVAADRSRRRQACPRPGAREARLRGSAGPIRAQ